MNVNHAEEQRGRVRRGLHRLAEIAGVLVGYAALAVVASWPLATRLSECLPMGSEQVRTVPFFNLWTMIWNVQCAERSLTHYSSAYWDAPIFFPNRNALAMSEPQPATQLLWPLTWVTTNWTVVYNIYFLLSLTLNGFVIWILFRRLEHSRLVSVGTGAAMLLLPIVYWQSGVIQLVPIWGVVWTLVALARILQDACLSVEQSIDDDRRLQDARRPRWWPAMSLAGGLTATFAMSAHHGVMLVVMAAGGSAVVSLFYWKELRFGRLLQIAVGAACLCAVIIGPEIWHLTTAASEYSLGRDAETVQQLSAIPNDYLADWGSSTFDQLLPAPARLWFLSPGVLVIVLALAGAIWGVSSSARRLWTVFWISIVVAGFIFSMGQHLQIGAVDLWSDIASRLPGLAQIRSVYRFAFFVQIGSVVLAANLFSMLELRLSKQLFWSRTKRYVVQGSIIGLGIWAIIDPWPPRMRLGISPKQSDLRTTWVSLLAKESEGGVLILPISDGGVVNDYEETTLWMLQSLVHSKPLVNGYSGFFPDQNLEISSKLNSDGLTSGMIAQLASMGVKYIVVTRFYASRGEDWSALQLLYEDSAVKLYRLSD